jgi:hypothetical protein
MSDDSELSPNALLGLAELFRLTSQKESERLPGMALVVFPLADWAALSRLLLAESIRRRERAAEARDD